MLLRRSALRASLCHNNELKLKQPVDLENDQKSLRLFILLPSLFLLLAWWIHAFYTGQFHIWLPETLCDLFLYHFDSFFYYFLFSSVVKRDVTYFLNCKFFKNTFNVHFLKYSSVLQLCEQRLLVAGGEIRWCPLILSQFWLGANLQTKSPSDDFRIQWCKSLFLFPSKNLFFFKLFGNNCTANMKLEIKKIDKNWEPG